MTAKTSPARRLVFLAALAETGNQALAAERARVSRAWVSRHQRIDPVFAVAMAEAVAAAQARLAMAARNGPGGRWRDQDGEELVVQRGHRRLLQVTRARLKQWTPRVEARFLAELAGNCNVKRACAAVGLHKDSAYRHRRRWPDFAARWDAAVEQGYDPLATAAIAAVGAMLGSSDTVPDAVTGPVSFGEAIHLLNLNNRRMAGRRRPRPLPPLPREQWLPRLMAKMELVERANQATMSPAARAARNLELKQMNEEGRRKRARQAPR